MLTLFNYFYNHFSFSLLIVTRPVGQKKYKTKRRCSVWLRFSFLLFVLRAIFCKSHPTCDSRVFRISSYVNQLKIKVIPEHGRNFSFIKHSAELLEGSRNNSSFKKCNQCPQAIFRNRPQPLRIAFQSSNYFYINLVRN